LLLSNSQSFSQQVSGSSSLVLVDHFLKANPNLKNISYWDSAIVPETLGEQRRSKIFLETIFTLLFYARSAGADVEVDDIWGDDVARKNSQKNTNYLITLSDKLVGARGGDAADGGDLTLSAMGIDLSEAAPSLQGMSQKGLMQIVSGCYENWSVDRDEHIKAMAIAIDSRLDEGAKENCVMMAVVDSFGVSPNVDTYKFSYGYSKDVRIFGNNSEVVLQLNAANFCRKE